MRYRKKIRSAAYYTVIYFVLECCNPLGKEIYIYLKKVKPKIRAAYFSPICWKTGFVQSTMKQKDQLKTEVQ